MGECIFGPLSRPWTPAANGLLRSHDSPSLLVPEAGASPLSQILEPHLGGMPFDSVKTGHRKTTVEGGFIYVSYFLAFATQFLEPLLSSQQLLTKNINKKHSSRMRTVRCSGRREEEGGVCPGGFGHVGV